MTKNGCAKVFKIVQDIDLPSIIEEFLTVKKAEGVTDYAIRSHRNALKYFFNEYDGDITNEKNVQQAVATYLADKRNEYYNKLLQAIRQFFEFCVVEGVIKTNPCLKFNIKVIQLELSNMMSKL